MQPHTQTHTHTLPRAPAPTTAMVTGPGKGESVDMTLMATAASMALQAWRHILVVKRIAQHKTRPRQRRAVSHNRFPEFKFLEEQTCWRGRWVAPPAGNPSNRTTERRGQRRVMRGWHPATACPVSTEREVEGTERSAWAPRSSALSLHPHTDHNAAQDCNDSHGTGGNHRKPHITPKAPLAGYVDT